MKIPEGIAIEIVGNVIRVKGSGGELEKKFNPLLLGVKIENGELAVSFKRKENRALRAAKNAMEAHVRNMIVGVTKGYEKRLEVVFAHFPVSIEVKGKDVFIKNFLGEKVARKARIAGDAQVVVAGNSITVKGNNKEDVGQTANNIVRATKIRERDIRVFQDGVYYSD
ncbi:MAG: 50S ribosomal protein L6 [Candidatus Micrarchaeota archaeon]